MSSSSPANRSLPHHATVTTFTIVTTELDQVMAITETDIESGEEEEEGNKSQKEQEEELQKAKKKQVLCLLSVMCMRWKVSKTQIFHFCHIFWLKPLSYVDIKLRGRWYSVGPKDPSNYSKCPGTWNKSIIIFCKLEAYIFVIYIILLIIGNPR